MLFSDNRVVVSLPLFIVWVVYIPTLVPLLILPSFQNLIQKTSLGLWERVFFAEPPEIEGWKFTVMMVTLFSLLLIFLTFLFLRR